MAAYYTFEDLSGSDANTTKTDNPYHDLIESCNNDPFQIQQRYATHRTNRNAQQKAKLLAEDFPGVTVDTILAKLEDPENFPNYQDPRHCLVFWARPTAVVRELIWEFQASLKKILPNLYTLPWRDLHMTALEVTHSLTAEEIDAMVQQMDPYAQEICNFTAQHRVKLVKPMLNFDVQAIALSFLPAEDQDYTYHHLRRDLYTMASKTGVEVASRYVIPSAHMTIARFTKKEDLEDGEGKVDPYLVKKLVERIEALNQELEKTRHYADIGGIKWIVGQDRGLEFRKGPLWYGGGGETVRVGKAS